MSQASAVWLASLLLLEWYHRHLDGTATVGPVLEAVEAGAFFALLIQLALPDFDAFESWLERFLAFSLIRLVS